MISIFSQSLLSGGSSSANVVLDEINGSTISNIKADDSEASSVGVVLVFSAIGNFGQTGNVEFYEMRDSLDEEPATKKTIGLQREIGSFRFDLLSGDAAHIMLKTSDSAYGKPIDFGETFNWSASLDRKAFVYLVRPKNLGVGSRSCVIRMTLGSIVTEFTLSAEHSSAVAAPTLGASTDLDSAVLDLSPQDYFLLDTGESAMYNQDSSRFISNNVWPNSSLTISDSLRADLAGNSIKGGNTGENSSFRLNDVLLYDHNQDFTIEFATKKLYADANTTYQNKQIIGARDKTQMSASFAGKIIYGEFHLKVYNSSTLYLEVITNLTQTLQDFTTYEIKIDHDMTADEIYYIHLQRYGNLLELYINNVFKGAILIPAAEQLDVSSDQRGLRFFVENGYFVFDVLAYYNKALHNVERDRNYQWLSSNSYTP